MARYPFCRAIRKHGDRIIVTTLVVGNEQYCLDLEYKLRPSEGIGWNIAVGGLAPMLGRKHSDETRKKIIATNTGRRMSEAQKDKLRGILRTPEWLANAAKAREQSTYIPSLETRRRMAESQRGRKLSAETKNKIRRKAIGHKRNVGRPVSERAKELIREKATGRRHTEATKLKLSRERAGIPVSPETLEKMRRTKRTMLTCPHCHKTGMAGGMKKHHMDHCKFKDQTQCPANPNRNTNSWKPPPIPQADTEASPKK
jgi:hypothetical protein